MWARLVVTGGCFLWVFKREAVGGVSRRGILTTGERRHLHE